MSGALEAAIGWTDAHHDELISLRRQLHAHPEPSGEEVATTELIVQRLRAAGAEPQVLDSGTGVVCDLGDAAAAPLVALRGDIDGLLMNDEKDVEYGSRNEGVAHACGHDVHTVTVLGAGLSLDSLLRDSGNSVRLIFEPSEERVPGGAVEVVGSGWLEGIRAVYGLHCDPKLDVGTVGTRVGPITSAADLLTVTLRGPGGHTARPHLTVDMVTLAASLAIDLPELLESRSDGLLQVVFGSVQSGEAANVIPTTATLAGSLRTTDRAAWGEAGPLLADSVQVLLESSGAEWSLDHRRGVPPVVNHRRETDIMSGAVVDVLGGAGSIDTPQSVGGDSYAWYLEATGGTYARLGTHSPADGARLDLHSGDFDVDEAAIDIGAKVLAAAVCRELDLG